MASNPLLLLGLGGVAAGIAYAIATRDKAHKRGRVSVTVPPRPTGAEFEWPFRSPGWPGLRTAGTGLYSGQTQKAAYLTAVHKIRTGGACCVECAYGRACSGSACQTPEQNP